MLMISPLSCDILSVSLYVWFMLRVCGYVKSPQNVLYLCFTK